MNYIKVTYPVGSSFIKSTFEDNSSYIRTSVNSTFIKVSYDGGSSGLDAERLRTKVYNVTGATLTKGTVVYINGTHGNLPSVTKAIATGDATSAQTLGLVMEDILDNKSGYIIIAGKLSDLDTQALANGAQLYLSSTVAGAYTTTKQYAPAHLVYIGIVNRSHPTQGEIEVKIQNGYEADEIHDFAVRNPLNNQGIFFNSTTNLWEKKYVSDALGYTPANASTTLTINGVTFDLSQNRSWTIAAGISGSGTSGQVSYWTGASSLGGSNNFFWDATNNYLGLGTNSPQYQLDVVNTARFRTDILVNGINIGLGAGNVASNLRFGGSALLSNTTGAGNVALGYAAMYYNTGGSNNMAIGVQALVGNSTGDNNVAVGTAALFNNTNGYNNVAIGHWAGRDSVGSASNTVGANNIFIGYSCVGESGIESNRTWIGNASTTSTWLGGNLLLGTRTDGGQRLQVVGSTFLNGAVTITPTIASGDVTFGNNAYLRMGSTRFRATGVSFQFQDNSYNDRVVLNTASGLSFFNSGGNYSFGVSTDLGVRLGVVGDTLLRGSGNTVATNALLVQNSDGTNILRVGNDRTVTIGLAGGAMVVSTSSTSLDRMAFQVLRDGVNPNFFVSQLFGQNTSGTFNVVSTPANFQPTSGTAVYNALLVNPTVNQTGGANGVTRGLYVAPTLTAAFDFRAIETTAGNVLFGTNFFWDNAQGRLGLGTNAPTVRLQVLGDTILRGSGATSGTTALTVQNSASTDLFVVRNDGSGFLKRAGNSSGFYIDTNGEFIRGGASGNISLGFGSGSFRGFFQFAQNHDNGNGDNWYFGYSTSSLSNTSTTGTNNFIGIQGNFRPTSGTASYSQLTIYPTINQTGGANGITRGFYINPTLTAAADWRSIQWDNNTGWGIYGAGTADNYLAGDLSIGTLTTTDWINIGASTTAKAHIFLTAGVDPTSPANGDIWFDGTNLKMRVGGVTRTFTLV